MQIHIDYRLNDGKPLFSIENLSEEDLQVLKLFIEDGIKNMEKNPITIQELSRMQSLLNEFKENIYTHNHNNGKK